MICPIRAITAQTQLYGIFGDPVEHSLSPVMQNAAFEKFGLNAVYLAFPVSPNELGMAFEGMRAMGIRGINITVPFKEAALAFVDEIPEDLDRRIGAINTVVQRQGRLVGYNTDASGFIRALKEELNFEAEKKTVLVLGAGGAARAVVFSLAYGRAERIVIANRTGERAQGLKEYAADFFPKSEIRTYQEFQKEKRKAVDLVVNATSCGMNGNDGSPLDLAGLGQAPAVYDLIYAPQETPLLKQAKQLGLANANGLGMLINQGALAFEIWTGKKEGVREAMKAAIGPRLG